MSWGASDAVAGEVVSIAGVAYVLFEGEGRSAGSLSWSSCNPGNIITSEEAERYGAYAGAHNYRFAVFPDEDTGQSAIIHFLQNPVRSGKTILQMMELYAPAHDGPNSPLAYANQIATDLGVGINTVVKLLDADQLTTMADTIRRIEGWAAHDDTRLVFDEDDLPDALAQWLSEHVESSERARADQPYADVLAPASPGIANLQELFNAAGASPQLVADGMFGPKSKAAALAFQQDHGLIADGIVGPGTWRALLDVLNT